MHCHLGTLLILLIGAAITPVLHAQQPSCSGQACYAACYEDSTRCLTECRTGASQVRNPRQARIFWRQCLNGCDAGIADCHSTCDRACRQSESDFDACSRDCLWQSVRGTRNCRITWTAGENRESCIVQAQSDRKSCETDCQIKHLPSSILATGTATRTPSPTGPVATSPCEIDLCSANSQVSACDCTCLNTLACEQKTCNDASNACGGDPTACGNAADGWELKTRI
ncbi:uncharacterized protein BO97DRAFT_421963 [Aspergillus homomorphus CBS 101889]|uniref:Extracellular membrane protein CFEM domain-containing protein n=1 Tax=Aspergillus homomorphus (strain CBS 101889) TaxID=1450537 RepID=A0A395I4P9_ASPHC|nr:hypothetical protein BO97DRAFT_421963 [Aspergillus homomorphus CBS 101889]RAL15171.1 hypothetical protein BO97DRAFT_421963 [Aspergillus homomorphus CBS 101889]